MMHRKLSFTTLALVMIAALLLSPALPTAQAAPRSAPDAPDATYTPSQSPPPAISRMAPPQTGQTDCGELGWPNTATSWSTTISPSLT